MAGQYQSSLTGTQIDNTITLVVNSTDTNNETGNVPSSTNKIATLNKVNSLISGAGVPTAGVANPLMDGTANAGTPGEYATATHVHPTDTSRQATLVSGTNIKTVEGKTLLGSGNIDITAEDVGLGNVTNESKTTMFANPAFTGAPTAPTAAAGTNNTQLATTAFVQTAISNIPQGVTYKGTIGKASGGTGTRSTIPTTDVKVGDMWLIVDEAKTLSASASATGQAVALEIGDSIIATATTPKWATSAGLDEEGVTSIAAGTGLTTDKTGGAAITGSGTISLAAIGSTLTPGTYGGASAVPHLTVDSYGRITSIDTVSVTIPSYEAGPGIDITNDTISDTYTTCTLPAFSAAGSQNVAVTGVTANSHPTLDVYIANSSSVNACNEAWSHIYRADSYNGGITFYSDASTNSTLTVMVKGY